MATLEHCKGSNDVSFALGVFLHARNGGVDLSGDYIGDLHALYCAAYKDGRLARLIRYFRGVL